MKTPKTRTENIVVQEIENEILIYDLETNKAFCLNETSALIYQLCDGKKSVEEISQHIKQKLNQPISEDLIWLALDNFKKDNLFEEGEQIEIDFGGLTRRQIIKKVGLASMIALPVVASVIAPSAAMAQSGGVLLGGACPPACASGLQCRSLSIGVSNVCCVPASPATQTFTPGQTFCNTSCAATPSVCCSGLPSPAPASAFCTMFGLVNCVCDPYP